MRVERRRVARVVAALLAGIAVASGVLAQNDDMTLLDDRPVAERHSSELPVDGPAAVRLRDVAPTAVDLQTRLKDVPVEEIDGRLVVRVVENGATRLVPAED